MVLANVPSFRFSFRGNIRRNHPFGNHQKGSLGDKRAVSKRVVLANVPSFRFSFRGNIRRNHPFGNHPFANPRIVKYSARSLDFCGNLCLRNRMESQLLCLLTRGVFLTGDMAHHLRDFLMGRKGACHLPLPAAHLSFFFCLQDAKQYLP